MQFNNGIMNSIFDIVFGIADRVHAAVGMLFNIIFG